MCNDFISSYVIWHIYVINGTSEAEAHYIFVYNTQYMYISPESYLCKNLSLPIVYEHVQCLLIKIQQLNLGWNIKLKHSIILLNCYSSNGSIYLVQLYWLDLWDNSDPWCSQNWWHHSQCPCSRSWGLHLRAELDPGLGTVLTTMEEDILGHQGNITVLNSCSNVD